jgi:hypothetical protein
VFQAVIGASGPLRQPYIGGKQASHRCVVNAVFSLLAMPGTAILCLTVRIHSVPQLRKSNA